METKTNTGTSTGEFTNLKEDFSPGDQSGRSVILGTEQGVQ